MHNRAESYSNRGNHDAAKTCYYKCESLCEDALEVLEEIIYADEQLRIWFDRGIVFEAGGELGADLVSLPRVVTSRSNDKLSGDMRIMSKLEVKLSIVERAIYNIGRDS